MNMMKKEHRPLNDYLYKLINLNAKERLSLVLKNVELPLEKSSTWKFNPNLEEIMKKEKNYYKENNIKQNKKYEFNPIDNKHYYPKFIKEMNDQQIKEFSSTLNNKIRRVKLTMAKLQLDAMRYKNYEKEEKKKVRNISLKHEMKILFDKNMEKKEYNSPRLEQLNTERAYNFGIVKTYKNIGERFENYKNDFNKKLKDLECSFETKLLRRYTILNKNNKKNKSPLKINKVIEGYTSNTLLPNINEKSNTFKNKEIDNFSRNKKIVNFNLTSK